MPDRPDRHALARELLRLVQRGAGTVAPSTGKAIWPVDRRAADMLAERHGRRRD